jgi:hypothetical protein
MRRDLIRSARGVLVNFDDLAAKAAQKPKDPLKTNEVKIAVQQKKQQTKLRGNIVPQAEEATPAESAMITATFKKKAADKKSTADSDTIG